MCYRLRTNVTTWTLINMQTKVKFLYKLLLIQLFINLLSTYYNVKRNYSSKTYLKLPENVYNFHNDHILSIISKNPNSFINHGLCAILKEAPKTLDFNFNDLFKNQLKRWMCKILYCVNVNLWIQSAWKLLFFESVYVDMMYCVTDCWHTPSVMVVMVLEVYFCEVYFCEYTSTRKCEIWYEASYFYLKTKISKIQSTRCSVKALWPMILMEEYHYASYHDVYIISWNRSSLERKIVQTLQTRVLFSHEWTRIRICYIKDDYLC